MQNFKPLSHLILTEKLLYTYRKFLYLFSPEKTSLLSVKR